MQHDPEASPLSSTWILPLDEGGGPLRVALKDVLDWRGTATTAGCRAVAAAAAPARADAACLAGLRAAVAGGRARVVGKAACSELAADTTGTNAWYGTPVNPVDARLVPGGSSSGCAVAVGAGEADVAIGTDTAGSVRIPSACCGTVGLKTTWGRLPAGGVFPLAPSLDTVGPLARSVAGVVDGMRLLDPSFGPLPPVDGRVGRVRVPLPVDRRIDRAVDRALAAAGLEVVEVRLPGWVGAGDATLTVLVAEAWAGTRHLRGAPGVSAGLRERLAAGALLAPSEVTRARRALDRWRAELSAALAGLDALVLPTVVVPPPTLSHGDPDGRLLLATAPVNGAGLPALALPAGPLTDPGGPGQPARPWPVSLQLVGPPGGEERLCAVGGLIEAAAG